MRPLLGWYEEVEVEVERTTNGLQDHPQPKLLAPITTTAAHSRGAVKWQEFMAVIKGEQ